MMQYLLRDEKGTASVVDKFGRIWSRMSVKKDVKKSKGASEGAHYG